MNASSNIVQWTPYPQMDQYQNTWFFGRSSPPHCSSVTRICVGSNSSNFTATNQLFLANPIIAYWRFEVVYTLPSERSSSALSFVINQPPRNGSCTVAPLNGTTSTSFTLTCSRWQDEDGIKDYSIYSRTSSLRLTHSPSRSLGWTTSRDDRTMIAFSYLPTMSLRLPAGPTNSSSLQLIVIIRDQLDCVMEVDLPSVIVRTDSVEIDQFLQSLQTSNFALNSIPLVQILSSGNQNAVGQVLSSLSQQFNGISPHLTLTPTPMNQSAFAAYNKQRNNYANARDFLMTFSIHLSITTANSITMQASSLSQLTQATNQLTRSALIVASDKCHQLATVLRSMATQVPYEDVQSAATSIAQCTTNALTVSEMSRPERSH